MLAVIKTGGKQYLVSPKDKIKIEKIEGKEGDKIEFSEILLIRKNKKTSIGTPTIKGAKVIGKILRQARAKKIVVFKYKAKKRYKKKKGHKQPFTEIEIIDIKK